MSTNQSSAGKIQAQSFKELILNHTGARRSELLTGPQFGVDTAIIDLGDSKALAVSSDPLSLIPSLGLKESAWLSVHLLVNDMATTGHAPQYAQFILNLPEDFGNDAFKTYWRYIHEFCSELNIAITGGHTGRVPGQHSTVCGGGTMFLQAPRKSILSSNKALPGDTIIMTKESALSATAILAKSFPVTFQKVLGRELFEKATQNFFKTSSLDEAVLAAGLLKSTTELRAMHDVTEGGILGALCEMAQASGCGFSIDDDQINVGRAQEKIAAYFDIDHRYCIGSGSMLMAVNPDCSYQLVEHLSAHGIEASILGTFTENAEAYQMLENGRVVEVVYDGVDPYWEAFYSAMKNGLK